MSAHAVHPLPDPALAGIRDRLTQQFALHRRGAPFWAAFQDMQQEITRDIRATTCACATRWPTWPKTSVPLNTHS